MAYKFIVTIDYPSGKTRGQYAAWMEEVLGSTTFADLTERLIVEDALGINGDKKSDRVDTGSIVIYNNYHLNEDQATALRDDLTVLLKPLGENLVIGDIETITAAQYESV